MNSTSKQRLNVNSPKMYWNPLSKKYYIGAGTIFNILFQLFQSIVYEFMGEYIPKSRMNGMLTIFQELVLRLKAGILSAFQLYNSEISEQNKLYF